MDRTHYSVPVPKIDVLMEDFSNIHTLIDTLASDRGKLLESRNTWNVFFMGYDDDPRELPDIPEVVNWIEQSVEEGIPWFYFMDPEAASGALLTFMICCGADENPDYPGQYIFDRDRIMPFIRKNLDNLAEFTEEYDIPDEIGKEITDLMLHAAKKIMFGSQKQEEEHASNTTDRIKQKKEAAERLSMLEKLHGLNPKVKKYFEDGKLYYSYLTGGGYIGSIDTINYDKRYAAVVELFEEKSSYLVYHVIEHKKTISLLYVSDNVGKWIDERPTNAGVKAWVFDMESGENELGYINIDCLQGALYRRNNTVHSSLQNSDKDLSDTDGEIIERLEILKNSGLLTDLDITEIYAHENEICCSLLQSIFGTPVGVVDRLSKHEAYSKLLEMISAQVPGKFYFLMGSEENSLAYLFVSDDPDDWEEEKAALEKGFATAVVVDVDNMIAKIMDINFKIINGGPIFSCDRI